MLASSPGHSHVFSVEKREGLVSKITCVTYRVERVYRESLIASGRVKGHLDSSHSQQVSDKVEPMANECGTILSVCR